MGLQQQRASPREILIECPGFVMERCHPGPRGRELSPGCVDSPLRGLRQNTAGKDTIMWKNTIVEEEQRQENVFRVDTPLIKQCI